MVIELNGSQRSLKNGSGDLKSQMAVGRFD